MVIRELRIKALWDSHSSEYFRNKTYMIKELSELLIIERGLLREQRKVCAEGKMGRKLVNGESGKWRGEKYLCASSFLLAPSKM